MTLPIASYPIGSYGTPPSFDATPIGFGDLLFTGNYRLIATDHEDIPKIEHITYNIPLGNDYRSVTRKTRDRDINIDLSVSASTASDLAIALDSLKRSLALSEWVLTLPMRDGTVRSVVATCVDISIDSKYYQITFTKVKIKFKAHAYFYDGNSDIYIAEDISGDTSHLMNITGSVETSPIIYLVPGIGSSITQARITSNDYIDVSVGITQTLKIDSEDMDVTMNGGSIDYTGTFPIFSPWPQAISVDVTGSGTYSLYIVARRNYL